MTASAPVRSGSAPAFLPHMDDGLDGGHVQVTAYGLGTERCQVGGWFAVVGGRAWGEELDGREEDEPTFGAAA